MRDKDEHICTKMPMAQPVAIFYIYPYWTMAVEEYGDTVQISYCPFCGTDLED